MTRELVIKALEDAINHSGNVNGLSCTLIVEASTAQMITLKEQRKQDLF